ncbi:HAD-IIB family hydrolase [Rhodovulum adriaticum]|uniref:Mannosyl-3-phosphoglycerate phosphatase n=1 Tax=Rhodovulum adriaticum TaxID=35804 RepID=A0A4R2NIN7_RHOAD|nr:HAD-IIB family hydrolase [Rhodovulum adriaticum]MBK1636616.1 mannosyl-3-phosphoglycerate phosphatase [Rhodovulum adriaticum]TCP21353.1 mannosyl-3-phosphoglycerate phosphatase [Rhodovulum adriaticum]
MPRPALLIFTDLDGTLLDHDTYSYAAAEPALDQLRRTGVPVILASSKTAAEIAPLRAELGFAAHPAIVENGAGILEPGAEAPESGGRYDELRATLDRVPTDLRAQYQGFGDWDVAEIARRTGLPPAQAALAARRHHSEPGIWSGDADGQAAFVAALREHGVTARAGGRFLTLSFGGTKAGRMADIAARHRTPFVVALGDAPNDAEMLEQADLGFVIANPAHPPLPPLSGEAQGHIQRIDAPGPKGWNAAVERVITEYGF